MLNEAGLSFQRTRSWKSSPDPDFKAKAERVLGLYRDPPADGPVVCFDEMGPIQLIPHHGAGWAPVSRPQRLRATYNRRGGVRYLFGAYDVGADHFMGRLREHKSARDVLGFTAHDPDALPAPQAHLPGHGQPLHALDQDIRSWAQANNVELVPTPTYASFLNRIECHFWAVGEFVVKNADYPDWDTLAKAMADYIHLRNRTHGDQRLITAERKLLIAA